MERSEASLTELVQSYLDHVAAGGDASPRAFLGARGLADDAEARSVLALVAGRSDPRVGPGDRVGPYRLHEELGRGAQGVVYRAEDEDLGRRVALKLLAPQAALGATLDGLLKDSDGADPVERFRREAQAASRLDHPGICTVYAADVAGGVPYIAMRFVDGETLARRIARDGRPPDRAATDAVAHLVENVARALHVAHEAGLVHRDVKPGNIMVARDGEPVLCDFGLARDEEAGAALTRTGEVRGTPAYMSPEQLRGEGAVDRRTDVYSLGVVLYEALTGRCPVDGASWEVLFRQVLAEPPSDPRRVNAAIGRDLKVVLETALEKDPRRRYATALAFAEDLRCVRERRPIRARAASPFLRLRRWTQRRPALAASTFLLSFGLVAGPLVFAVQQRRANARLRAEKQAVERQHYAAAIAAADAGLRGHQVSEARRRLDACPEALRGWEWRYLRHAADQSLSVWPHDAPVGGVAVVGDLLATTEFKGALRLRDLATDAVRTADPVPELHGEAVAISPDGTRVAAADCAFRIRVWDARSGALVATLPGHAFWVRGLAFPEDDGTALVSCAADGTVRVWDLATGRVRHVWKAHTGEVNVLALAAGGSRLFTGGNDGALWEHDWRAGTAMRRVAAFDDRVRALALHPDGAGALVALADASIRITSLADGTVSRVLRGHEGRIRGLAFAAGGRLVLSTASEATVRAWDAASGAVVYVLRGHELPVAALAVDAARDRLVTGSQDHTVRSWSLRPRAAATTLHHGPHHFESLAFDPAGGRIAVAGWYATALVLDVATGEVIAVLREHPDRVFDIAWSPDGTRLATGCRDGAVRVWDAATGALLRIHATGSAAGDVEWLGDGEALVSAHRDGTLRFWPEGTVVDGHDGGIHALAQAPARGLLATAGEDRAVKVWDVATRAVRRELPSDSAARELAFRPDGRMLAGGSATRGVRVWDLATGELRVLHGHRAFVAAVAWSPDGTRLASGSSDRTVRVWDVARRETLLVFQEPAGLVLGLAFGPDGERLMGAGFDGNVRCWETRRPRAFAARTALSASVAPLVDELFRTHRWSPAVRDALAAADLTEPERAAAVRRALTREENAQDLKLRAWAAVARAGAAPDAYAEARACAETARRLRPADLDALAAAGAARLRTGDRAGARTALEAALAAGHRHPRVRAFLCLAAESPAAARPHRAALERQLAHPRFRDDAELQSLRAEVEAKRHASAPTTNR